MKVYIVFEKDPEGGQRVDTVFTKKKVAMEYAKIRIFGKSDWFKRLSEEEQDKHIDFYVHYYDVVTE
jgi:hypothetical protein